MSKKTAGGLLGTLVVAGVVAGVLKYLKDYAGASYTKDDEIDRVKKNSGEVKEAARRVYIAVKDKGDVKTEAAQLAKAAGDVVADAGNIAKTAGVGAYEAAKKIKEKYSEDPESAKDEMINNIKDMGMDIYDKAVDAADNVVNKFTSHQEEKSEDESDCDCSCHNEAADDNDDDTKVEIEAPEEESSVEISDEN